MTERTTRGRLLVVALLALATASVAVGAVAGPAAATPADASTANHALQTDAEAPTAEFSATYEPVDLESNTVLVTVTLENPEVLDEPGVEQVAVNTRGVRFTVEDSGDFVRDGSRTWVPRDGVAEPTMTLSVSRDDDYLEQLPSYDESSYKLLWLSGLEPDVRTETTDDTEVAVSIDDSASGEAFVHEPGDALLVGPHSTVNASTDHGPVTLVVPDAVEFEVEPERLVDAWRELSAVHDVEHTQDEIVVFPAPAHDGKGGVAYIDEGWFWAPSDGDVDTTTSAWYHEFVHVTDALDDREQADDFTWFTEAYASWYATYRPLEAANTDPGTGTDVHSRIPYSEFESDLEAGREFRANLSEPDQWQDGGTWEGANYDQGLLVIGAIDRQIRLETGGNASFDDVIATLDQRSGEIGHVDLLEAIFQVSGDPGLTVQAQRWIRGEERPEAWNASQHEAAYGYDPTPPSAAIADPHDPFCAGCPFEVDALHRDEADEVADYQWAMGDGTTYDGSWSVSHAYEEPGEYEIELTVIGENGFRATDTATVTVEAEEQARTQTEPHAEIAPSTTSPDAGQTVYFDLNQNTDWIDEREWTMGDGTSYSGRWHVEHSFDSPGTYTVSLETRSPRDDSRTTDTVTIEVS